MYRTSHAALDRGTTRRAPLRSALVVLTLFALTTAAQAQCVGDCNTDGEVTINELILGVNIALGSAPLTDCAVFDADASGDVTVNELIAAVNNALNGCSPTGTPTPTPPPGCGNGVVDFGLGETCDDGNTLDGDSCPATCRIAACTASGSMVGVDVSFTPPPGVDIGGLTVLLRYPDGVVRIPGSANAPAVQDRVTNLPDNAFSTLNDLDYALRVVMLTTDQTPFAPGQLFLVTFDTCQEAIPPATGMFSCKVEDAADTNAVTVTGVTCAAVLH